MAKVSVVIPIYNSEKTLHKCIQSVLDQTYDNWECILINDGSQDKSEEICRAYAEKDSRFTVVSKPNGGVSSARNQGIQRSTGDFVSFVDSDDYIAPTFLQSMLEPFETKDCVMSACRFAYEGKDNAPTGNDRMLTAEQAVATMFSDQGIGGYIGGKLFRMDVVRRGGLRFDEEQHLAEDMIFVYRYLRLCSENASVFSGKARLYCYVKREDSALQARIYAKVFQDKWLNMIDSFDKLLADCQERKIRRAIENRKVMQCVTLLRVMVRCNAKEHPRYKTLRRYVAEHLLQYIFDGSYTLKKRAGAIAILIFARV